jgi:hypothetical protein
MVVSYERCHGLNAMHGRAAGALLFTTVDILDVSTMEWQDTQLASRQLPGELQ